MGRSELHLPPDPQYAGLGRLVVGAAARAAGMSEDRISDLKIAVDEAFVVALRDHTHDDPLIFTFGPDDGRFEVRVVTGAASVPLAREPRGAVAEVLQSAEVDAEVREDGLGATLLRALADTVDLGPGEGGGSSLRFTFALQHTSPRVTVE